MDDSRVTLVSEEEVKNAEAYMLFYRVVDHPYSNDLQRQFDGLKEKYEKEQREQAAAVAAAAASAAATSISMDIESSSSTPASTAASANKKNSNGKGNVPTGPAASVKNNPRKRKAPEFTCGEEWARKRTTISENMIPGIRDIEAQVSEYIKFTPAFLKLLTEQASKPNAKVGHGPSSGICCT
jgi:hypothetical protein